MFCGGIHRILQLMVFTDREKEHSRWQFSKFKVY